MIRHSISSFFIRCAASRKQHCTGIHSDCEHVCAAQHDSPRRRWTVFRRGSQLQGARQLWPVSSACVSITFAGRKKKESLQCPLAGDVSRATACCCFASHAAVNLMIMHVLCACMQCYVMLMLVYIGAICVLVVY